MAPDKNAPANKVPEIRAGDTVVVLHGKDAGKRGKVERVLRNPSGERPTKAGWEEDRHPSGVGRHLGYQHRQTPHKAAPVDVPERPGAAGAAGRHRRQADADRRQQRDDHLPALRTGHARQAPAPQHRQERSRVRALQRTAGGGRVSGGLRQPLRGRGRPGAAEAVQLHQSNADPAPVQDRRQHRPGEALTNPKAVDAAVGDLAAITGQHPVTTKAKRSIAQFRLRTGNTIGARVTLRGDRMWDFLERLTRIALPRHPRLSRRAGQVVRRARQLLTGASEQLAFPEIDYDKVDRLRGLEISIVTTAKTDEESKRLLELLGMPFAG